MLDHTEKFNPNESCAILCGKITGTRAKIESIFLADNTDESPINFTISNKDLIAIYKKAKDAGTEVIGIFHSHPDSEAKPSATDKEFMKINPVVWVIYSGVDANFKAYVLEKEVQEVQIMDS